MFVRNPIRRCFIDELLKTDMQIIEDKNSPKPTKYIITPTGAKCNKILLCGALIEKDIIGEISPIWRGKLVDPTGSISIYAGQYHPEVFQTITEIELPEFVMMVGKPSIYTTEDNIQKMSIWVNRITTTTSEIRRNWIIETAKLTAKRIKMMQQIINADMLSVVGMKEDPSVIAKLAYEHYNTDVSYYKEMIKNALKAI